MTTPTGDGDYAEDTDEFDGVGEPLRLLASTLSVCELDCADGALFYRVLGAWCVPWAAVPLATFLPAWFALCPIQRRKLVADRMYFAEELDVDAWRVRMLIRDDAAMAAVMMSVHPVSHATTVRCCVKYGATQCLALWQRKTQALSALRLQSIVPSYVNLVALAAGRGNLSMLRALRENGRPGDDWGATEAAARGAAAGGHLACLAFLHEHGCPWNRSSTCAAAAAGGHIACLVYAHERGCPLAPNMVHTAAVGGHLECLVYAYDRGCGITDNDDTCSMAAEGGHLECLRYVHERGGRLFDAHTFSRTARRGHVACLRYLVDNGCRPPSGHRRGSVLCAAATVAGDLECLRFLHELGVPWDESACRMAAVQGGHAGCLRYLCENSVDDCFPAAIAARPARLLKYVATAAAAGHLEVLRYLYEIGGRWRTDMCMHAAAMGHMDCFLFLRDHACGGGQQILYDDHK